jgi:hypothetical protein
MADLHKKNETVVAKVRSMLSDALHFVFGKKEN